MVYQVACATNYVGMLAPSGVLYPLEFYRLRVEVST